jgi:hypothetical protein
VRIIETNIGELRERFYEFYDGVVCSVDVEMRSAPRTCEIIVQARDRSSDSGWSTVRFMVQAVSEFRFELGKRTFEVLSGGIQFGWRNGSVCIVFDAYPDDGPELPDLTRNIAYVIGESCDVEISLLTARR